MALAFSAPLSIKPALAEVAPPPAPSAAGPAPSASAPGWFGSDPRAPLEPVAADPPTGTASERSPVVDPPPPDAVIEPVKRVQDNFVPDILRMPPLDAQFDFSLLVRSSPRGVDGKMRQASERGFRFDEATVPIGSGGFMLGGSVGMALVYADRWIFPSLAFDLLHSVGSRPRLLSGRGGSIVSSETWTTYQIGVTMVGVGVRGKHRRWAGSVILEPGFVVQTTGVTAPKYDSSAEANAVAFSPRFQIAANGCRRLDPTLRLCLSVTPHVYALGFFNGFTLGFRTEIGP